MNEKYNTESTEAIETTEESSENSTEAVTVDIPETPDAAPDVPAGYDDGSGNDSVDISTGDSGQASLTVSGGDISNPDVTSGDTGAGGSQPDYRVAYTEIPSTDYTDAFLAVQESLDSLNSTLFLILLFLLLSWTEKKISVAVHKFTRERGR